MICLALAGAGGAQDSLEERVKKLEKAQEEQSAPEPTASTEGPSVLTEGGEESFRVIVLLVGDEHFAGELGHQRPVPLRGCRCTRSEGIVRGY